MRSVLEQIRERHEAWASAQVVGFGRGTRATRAAEDREVLLGWLDAREAELRLARGALEEQRVRADAGSIQCPERDLLWAELVARNPPDCEPALVRRRDPDFVGRARSNGRRLQDIADQLPSGPLRDLVLVALVRMEDLRDDLDGHVRKLTDRKDTRLEALRVRAEAAEAKVEELLALHGGPVDHEDAA